MAKREQIQKKSAETKTETVAEAEPKVSETAETLKDELDELLDEIDEVLEVNAEEFVKGYVQKGGQ
jgi:prokaryotic ubiquitin-like protein Pup